MHQSSFEFDDYFSKAAGVAPFPFQKKFADELPALVDVPTGLGKTAMAILGWLWRRRFAPAMVRQATPRRLVYCLPMRVLVEQTRDNACAWIEALRKKKLLDEDATVHMLMGGEDASDWELYPERDMILIGTQDMLLSRALNRGYAASRARWPMHFGLLNTDCLWVFDEIQLMGSGLATTAQLEAFRHLLGTKDGDGCRSVWMSATLRPDWLRTVDLEDRIDDHGRIDGREPLSLTGADHENGEIDERWSAQKPLDRAKGAIGQITDLCEEIVAAHDKSRGRTIVVVNTVKRACDLLSEIKKKWIGATDENLILIHSRFRPPDRAAQIRKLMSETPPEQLPPEGMIVVSTQVIEAGVDVSATTLITELAPWASLVQRFGRCNRRGKQNDRASVHWINLPDKDADAEKVRFPYELTDLRAAAEELENLKDVGLASLDVHKRDLSDEKQEALFPHQHTHIIRTKDLIDFFDTTPDLAGNDIDVDRYVREVEETDMRLFWRDYGDPAKGNTPNTVSLGTNGNSATRIEPAPVRDELCPAPIGDFKMFAGKHRGRVWRWNFTEKAWEQADADAVVPGQVCLVHRSAGGYDADRGWTGDSKHQPSLDFAPKQAQDAGVEGYDDDHESQTGVWQSIAEHTEDVRRELSTVLEQLPMDQKEADGLRNAARWHDWGKAHNIFQDAVRSDNRPDSRADSRLIAKAPTGFWQRYERKHFRHELASALAVLQRPHESLHALSDEDLDLVAYLIAAHHGKVRLSIRSMPNETRPPSDNGLPRRFARGVWDGDELPSVDLGGSVVAPAVTLSLEPMEIGLCEEKPFVGQQSWLERALRLRDTLGPFRLAYLEALLRAADWRASVQAAAAGGGSPAPEEVAHV